MLIMLIRLLIEALFHYPEGISPGHFPTDWDEFYANLEREARRLPPRRVPTAKWPIRIAPSSNTPASNGLGM